MLARLARLFGRTAAAPVWVEAAELRRWLAGEGAPIIVDVRGALEGSLRRRQGAQGEAHGTHEATLEIVPLDVLKKYAIDLS